MGSTFGQLLYAGDDLSGDAWDKRGWDSHASGREMLFRLAAEACLGLPIAERHLRVRYPPRMKTANLVTPADSANA